MLSDGSRLDLQTMSTCTSQDSVLSIATPRLRTLVASSTLTVWRSRVLVELSARCRALKQSDSVDVDVVSLNAI